MASPKYTTISALMIAAVISLVATLMVFACELRRYPTAEWQETPPALSGLGEYVDPGIWSVS